MKKNFWITAIVVLVVLAGCSTTYNSVSTDFDRSADFSQYKTFAWLPDKTDTAFSPYNNEIIRNNIRNYFGQCMSDRGYSFNIENPDILMQLVITNSKKQKTLPSYSSINYYRPYYYGSHYYQPYSFGYYYRYYPSYSYSTFIGYPNTYKIEYINGSITLNFIDRKTSKLIWTGTAEGDIYDPAMVSRDLHPAVHRILDQYPVKSLVSRGHKIK